MTLEMLSAYYSCGCDSADLFKGCKIESDNTFKERLNRYDVLLLNMQQFLSRAKEQGMIQYLEQAVLRDLREEYGDLFSEQTSLLVEALEQIYAQKGKQFIFLIDEWDCVMREQKDAEELQRHYLDFLLPE